ncbi:MAG: helix-turn-helix domain-containing protein [Pseudomonadota bacterium]
MSQSSQQPPGSDQVPLTLEQLGRVIKFHRGKAGLTQVQLARLAGIGKTAVFDMENGKKSARIDTILNIFSVLNVRLLMVSPLMALFNGLDEKESHAQS